MKKINESTAKKRLTEYFRSRYEEKRDSDGNLILGKNKEVLYEVYSI